MLPVLAIAVAAGIDEPFVVRVRYFETIDPESRYALGIETL